MLFQLLHRQNSELLRTTCAPTLACLAGAALSLASATACELHPEPMQLPVSAKVEQARWVGPAYSGSWFDPSRSGEGFVLQILQNGSAIAVWFTYPPAGSPAAQAWIFAQDGVLEKNRIRFNAITTRGPKFGEGFNATPLQSLPWGTLEFEFSDCNTGTVNYTGPAVWGNGTRNLTRLSSLAESNCSAKTNIGVNGARTMDGLKQRSGAWFDPTHNGEGWMLEELNNGQTLAYWFTYDQNGEQAWTIGQTTQSAPALKISQVFRPIGTRFGTAFNTAEITNAPWGEYSIDFSNCNQGALQYRSVQPAFGQGSLNPIRLASLAGMVCLDQAPSVPSSATWSRGASAAVGQSEMPVALIGDQIYVPGGYRSGRDFKRYSIPANTWTDLPALPGSRDHGMALAQNGSLYVFGGYLELGQGDLSSPGWRFDIAQQTWTPMPTFAPSAASGATTLAGKFYFGSAEGIVTQLDPITGVTRALATDTRAPRDHSQLVAFQGELWLLGGRAPLVPANNRVSIFDPGSETWRPGPNMSDPRSGFAAAASDRYLILNGGEHINGVPRVISTSEIIVAGAQQFSALPSIPAPVHGHGGVIHGNAFFAIGGSKTAGIARNEGDVQILRW